jgi:para-nitrobenzyl esterase
MKHSTPKFLFFLFTAALYCFAGLSAQKPVAKIKNGLISGYKSGDIAVFKGIPFAEPPVGNLRWKAPQPKSDWKGTLECVSFSASPVQNKPVPFMMWTEEFITPPEKLSEDCLYLNVWTPSKSSGDKLPVFVWIYGGGFSSGSAACAIYDGEEMAKKGIVFVSINYRVGVLGFLAHPELSKESTSNTSGNYGLLDQVAALKWIRDNITAFGGDPGKVTIAGQSAGSMSVWSMIVSPLTKGLFRAAIPQSGGITTNLLGKSYEAAEARGVEYMKNAKAADIAELRNVPAEELFKISSGNGAGGGLSFAPVFDGYVLPKDVLQAFKDGSFNNVTVMAGWVTGDGNMGFGPKQVPEKYRQDAIEKYGDNAEKFLKLFPGNTAEELKSSASRLGLLSFAAMADYTWAGFTKSPLYVYEFSHVPVDKPGFPNYGAFHTSEVPFALNNLYTWKRPWRDTDLTVEKTMSSYWANFIKTANPNGAGLPEWKTYVRSSGDIMEIGDQSKMISGLYKNEFEFLEKVNSVKQ